MKVLKPFQKAGWTKDIGHFVSMKQSVEEAVLTNQMRYDGYTPVLDITPIVQFQYNEDKESFLYTVTMYGYHVGVDVWNYQGWLNGNLVPHTPPSKSKQLSNH